MEPSMIFSHAHARAETVVWSAQQWSKSGDDNHTRIRAGIKGNADLKHTPAAENQNNL
jgi:hypothetical protein